MKRFTFNRGGNAAIAILGGVIAKGTGPEQITLMQRDRFADVVAWVTAACRIRSIAPGRAE